MVSISFLLHVLHPTPTPPMTPTFGEVQNQKNIMEEINVR
jgi:hypothetical protein